MGKVIKRTAKLIRKIGGKKLAILPVAIGAGFLAYLIFSKQKPRQNKVSETARRLRVVEIQQRRVTPHVVGYGLARPARTWRAIARVEGEVIETHPRLNSGELVEAGARLIKIDPTDYELALARLRAEADVIDAEIEELSETVENNRQERRVQLGSMSLIENELQRGEELLPEGAISRTEYDQTRRRYLEAEQTLLQLEESLDTLPTLIEQAEARQDKVRQQLKQARRDLTRTDIVAPFRGRLQSVNIEPNQYVANKQQLLTLQSIDAVEVEANLPLNDLAKLSATRSATPTDPETGLQSETNADRATVREVNNSAAIESAEQTKQRQPSRRSSSTNESRTDPPAFRRRQPSIYALIRGLNASVRVTSGDWIRTWPAEVVRVRESVNPKTRTVGVVVRVDRGQDDRAPSKDSRPVQPPILENTFCEVIVLGQPRNDAMTLPATAVHADRVYVVDDQQQLRRKTIAVEYSLGKLGSANPSETDAINDSGDTQLVITGDVRPGDQVTLIDPSPAVEGMLVDPVLVHSNQSDAARLRSDRDRLTDDSSGDGPAAVDRRAEP